MALGLQAPAHVGEREVGVLGLGDGDRLDAVALVVVGSGIEGITETHIGVEGIVSGTRLLLGHGIVEGDADLRLVGEELTELE